MSAQKRIIVIDDDQDFLSYVNIVLEASGYQVDTASSVAEGLRKMRQVSPDLVIADVMISHVLNGWTIGQEIKTDARLAHIPILMVSAIVSAQDGDLFPGAKNGLSDAFMSKPIEPGALLQCVADLLHKERKTGEAKDGPDPPKP